MSEPRVRTARFDDLPSIGALNRGALPAVADSTDAELWRLIEQAILAPVVEIDGTVVAFMIALGPGVDYPSPNYRFFAERYPEFAYVDRIVVSPSHQRHGFGALLYEALEKDVAGHVPLLACEVNVRPRNDTSLAFHAALGFTAVGEQDTHDGAQRVRMFVREL